MRLANRTTEMEFFRKMLGRAVPHKILLVEAPSGYGKTDLLGKFSYSCPQDWQLVQVDLKGATSGVIYLISRLQQKLGRDRFPNYETAVRSFLNNGIEISKNQIVGEENTLQVILQGVDPTQQTFRLSSIYNAFFQDLAKLPPIVFILDTFDDAPKQLQDWLSGRFLAEIAGFSHLVVIAGQKVPKPTIEWGSYHHHFRLDVILEVESWHEYAQGEGFRFSHDHLQIIVHLLDGKPAEIVKALQDLERKLQR